MKHFLFENKIERFIFDKSVTIISLKGIRYELGKTLDVI